MSQERRVAITYRRQASDGNYGTEAFEVSLEGWVTDDTYVDEDRQVWGEESADAIMALTLLREAKLVVIEQMRSSFAPRVRQAAEPPKMTAADIPDEDDLPY